MTYNDNHSVMERIEVAQALILKQTGKTIDQLVAEAEGDLKFQDQETLPRPSP